MKTWRVTFSEAGEITDVTEIEGEGSAEWVVVQADSLERARVKAYRVYCARKRRESVQRLHAQGRCRCGRKQDRPGMKSCSVCAVGDLQQREKRKRGQTGPRDEAARVAAFQQRNRDRRAEIRLETLLEVRKWWQEAPHTLAFVERMRREIEGSGWASGRAATVNDLEAAEPAKMAG